MAASTYYIVCLCVRVSVCWLRVYVRIWKKKIYITAIESKGEKEKTKYLSVPSHNMPHPSFLVPRYETFRRILLLRVDVLKCESFGLFTYAFFAERKAKTLTKAWHIRSECSWLGIVTCLKLTIRKKKEKRKKDSLCIFVLGFSLFWITNVYFFLFFSVYRGSWNGGEYYFVRIYFLHLV